ncbi:MAG: helix-turn-helix transcriptional regulator [Desulfovibrio sp.]|nr:helix-turn-helix transcriptional regulator [Desulfovibrio sp.]
MINRLLGLRIRRLREAGGQTQYELAEQAEVSPKHLGELERGRGIPRLAGAPENLAQDGPLTCRPRMDTLNAGGARQNLWMPFI